MRRYDDSFPESSPTGRVECTGARGPQRIIRQAGEAELEAFLEGYAADRDAQSRRAVVLGGYLP